MGKIKTVYFRDDAEYKVAKACLDIYRSGLNKEQINMIMGIIDKARAAISTPEQSKAPEQPKVIEKGFWGETLPSGWRMRDLGPLGKRLEGPDGRWAYRDKSGAFEEYRAACEAEGIKLDA